MATSAPMPAKMAPRGRRLWKDITEKYDLRPDEVRVLEDACREVDIIERLESELRDGPLMVRGSQGQLVSSPLVSELRQHRSVLAGLLRSLKLPDGESTAAQREQRESEQARAAARARWDRRRSS